MQTLRRLKVGCGLLAGAAVCLNIVAATLPEPSPASTLLTVASLICYLSGVLWLSFAILHRAGWVHAEDWKMHIALIRDYLKEFVIRDRR